jgi:ubiquinone/menaquinone biosynthesis C-methylase UbiE
LPEIKNIKIAPMTDKIKKRYDRIAGFYDILEKPMEHMLYRYRENIMNEIEGKMVLEAGVGTGKNIPLYPDDIDITAIDFSEKMIEKAKKRSQNHENIHLHVMDIENMDFQDDTFDTVITSCVFCSVPDPVQGFREIRRVCRRGGKILMLEHVRSNKRIIGGAMDILNFIPLNIYGANINRRTYDNLLKAGFDPADIDVEYLWSDIVLFFRISNNKP